VAFPASPPRSGEHVLGQETALGDMSPSTVRANAKIIAWTYLGPAVPTTDPKYGSVVEGYLSGGLWELVGATCFSAQIWSMPMVVQAQ